MTYKELEKLLQTMTEEEKENDFEVQTSCGVHSYSRLFIDGDRDAVSLSLVDDTYIMKKFKEGLSIETLSEQYNISVSTVESYVRESFK